MDSTKIYEKNRISFISSKRNANYIKGLIKQSVVNFINV